MTESEPAFARPRVAAGVLFFDEAGRLLMVVPSYKDYLDIPGGYVEPGESPLEAARREVHEELGIEPPIGRLLVVDWSPNTAEGDKLIFIFDGGELSQAERSSIRVDGDEVTAYEFHPVDAVHELTIPSFTRRIEQAAAARHDKTTRNLQNGQPTHPPPSSPNG